MCIQGPTNGHAVERGRFQDFKHGPKITFSKMRTKGQSKSIGNSSLRNITASILLMSKTNMGNNVSERITLTEEGKP